LPLDFKLSIKQEAPKAAEITEIDFDSSHLIQYVPKYEELGIIDIKEHDPRSFALFLSEAK
jgi:hypothetical protein